MPEMTERIVSLLNSVAVGLFGIILSASFCDALQKRRDRIILLVCMVIMTVLHGIVLMNISYDTALIFSARYGAGSGFLRCLCLRETALLRIWWNL